MELDPHSLNSKSRPLPLYSTLLLLLDFISDNPPGALNRADELGAMVLSHTVVWRLHQRPHLMMGLTVCLWTHEYEMVRLKEL